MEMDFSNKVSIELDFKLLKQRHFLTNFRFWLLRVELRKSISTHFTEFSKRVWDKESTETYLLELTPYNKYLVSSKHYNKVDSLVWEISNWVMSSAFICIGKY